MIKHVILLGIVIATSGLLVIPYSNYAMADVISCVPSIDCDGTNDDDIMKGTKQGDAMRGEGGNDKMIGNDGRDEIIGDAGDDTITGGSDDDYIEARENDDHIDGGLGNDILLGDDEDGDAGNYGADVILGGRGDDQLFHSQYIESHGGQPTNSDGSKDRLDCGPGDDEAWINVNTDHDVVKNCETVHTEVN